MKKIFAILGVALILLASGVFAENMALSSDIQDAVKQAVEKKGISEQEVQNIEEVDFNNLPKEVDIKNIDDTNLALYKVDYGQEKPFYVITVSDEKFRKTAEEISRRMLLEFGSSEIIVTSSFLKSSTGVQTSAEKGYVMMRAGSITGLSTSLEVLTAGEGNVEIIIYKNGQEIGFRNVIVADKNEVKKDYDVQSENIVNFEQGDVISVYTKINGEISVKDINTLVEIITFEK